MCLKKFFKDINLMKSENLNLNSLQIILNIDTLKVIIVKKNNISNSTPSYRATKKPARTTLRLDYKSSKLSYTSKTEAIHRAILIAPKLSR